MFILCIMVALHLSVGNLMSQRLLEPFAVRDSESTQCWFERRSSKLRLLEWIPWNWDKSRINRETRESEIIRMRSEGLLIIGTTHVIVFTSREKVH